MRWLPYEHIFFDCDSTLTTIEGIDVLAETTSYKQRVEELTNLAMESKLDLEDIYAKGLQSINPTQRQIQAIRNAYKRNIVEDATEVVRILQESGKKVYIISDGLLESVVKFGVFLGVPRNRIHAVDVQHDELAGNWWQGEDADARYMRFEEGILSISDGKAEIVKSLLAGQNGRSLLVGDGKSDLLASRAVDLFVGFGGVIARQLVQAEAPIFINTPSMAPLLAIAMGPAQLASLNNTQIVQKI
ncbi:MAG: HAD-IB family phosphatase, partial [Anaerolineales bacterium]|nr:HAD-IB family phosphatase [Anaerolineales bacterium]